MDTSELACVYAALILHDDGIEITAEKISTLLKAANVEVESYWPWPSLFAKLGQKKNIDDLIMYAGAIAATVAAAPVASVASEATQAAPAAEEKKNKKEEVKEESEDDMVFGLFD